MASRRPLTINGGERELLQPSDSIDIGGYTLPNAAGDAGDYLVMGASNAAWINRTPTKTVTVAATGADYTTIQAALDDNTDGGELIQVYPGTYTDDTIAFTAAGQTVQGMGHPHTSSVTTANDNIVDYGNNDDCSISRLDISVTAAGGTDDTITGSGSLHVHECTISMVAVRALAGAQPACFGGTGDVVVHNSELEYEHHGAIGTAAASFKACISLGPGSTYHFINCDTIITTSNSCNEVTFAYGPATGIFHMQHSEVDIEDSTSLNVTALLVEDDGDYELAYNHFHIKTTGDGQIGCVVKVLGSATIRSMFNRIHVEDNGHVDSRSRSFCLTAGTVTSQLDDIIAEDNTNNSGGALTFCSSEEDGDFSASGNFHNITDGGKHSFGEEDDYNVEWDGDNAVHTISAGAFNFDGGAIRHYTVNTTQRDAISPSVNGMVIYNSQTAQPEFYANGSWETLGADSSDTLDDVADRGATTDQILTVGGINTTGDIVVDSDSSELKLGDDTDYTQKWDGSNAVHTISAGAFNFDGGAIRIPTFTTTERDNLTPINGFIIYNSNVNLFQIYENGGWQSWSSGIATNVNAINALDLQDVCANDPSTSYEVIAGGFKTTAHYHCFANTSKHYFGAGDEYQIYYNGTNAIHYLVGGTGSFQFNNGAIGVPQMNDVQRGLWTTSPYEGMLIFNTDEHILQVYRFTSWQNIGLGTDDLPDQGGHSGEYLTTNGTTASWSSVTTTDTLDDVADRGATTDQTLTVGGITTTGDLIIDSDSSELKLGDDTDYTQKWDGDNAVHTIPVTAAFEFDGGAVRLPNITTAERDALSAENGMLIYNTTVEKFQLYEDGSWIQKARVITADTNFYIVPTGSDSTGDGSIGNPWLSIDAAMSEIDEWVLLGFITIYIEKGSYTPTSSLNIAHPDGGKIQILGDFETDTITLDSSSGSSGNWSLVFTTTNTSYYTVDDMVLIHSATGGSDTDNVLGTLEVTAIDPGVSVTLHSPVAVTPMASGAVVATVSIPQVKWVRPIIFGAPLFRFQGIQVHYSASSNFEYILKVQTTESGTTDLRECIVYNTNATNYGSIRSYSSSRVSVRNFGVRHLYNGWFVDDIFASTTSGPTDCTYGFRTYAGIIAHIDSHFISNTTALHADFMGLCYKGGGTAIFVGNTLDASPALNSEGNHNSYMGI